VAVSEITVENSGYQGAPGLMRWYVSGTPTGNDAITNFYNAIKGGFAAGTTWQVHNSGNTYAESTAEITGAWSVGADGPPILASANVGYAAGVGLKLSLLTSTIVNRRRVRGGCFIIPLSSQVYQPNGTIADDYLASVRDALEALFAAEDALVVWSRPFVPRLGQGGTARVGSLAPVTSVNVADKVSWLRSRR